MTPVALTLLPTHGNQGAPTRTGRDRLEVLGTLIAAPSFDPMFRGDVITVPGDHAVYRWVCTVPGCQRVHNPGHEWCQAHYKQWSALRKEGADITEFLRQAQPLEPKFWHDAPPCLICPQVPATSKVGLCYYHFHLWSGRRRAGDQFEAWLARQRPYPGYGVCLVVACPDLASTPVGLCFRHVSRYRREGAPGGAAVPRHWRQYGEGGRPAVSYSDEARFRRWCRETGLARRIDGRLSLLGLRRWPRQSSSGCCTPTPLSPRAPCGAWPGSSS